MEFCIKRVKEIFRESQIENRLKVHRGWLWGWFLAVCVDTLVCESPSQLYQPPHHVLVSQFSQFLFSNFSFNGKKSTSVDNDIGWDGAQRERMKRIFVCAKREGKNYVLDSILYPQHKMLALFPFSYHFSLGDTLSSSFLFRSKSTQILRRKIGCTVVE